MTKKITKLMLNGQEYEIREYQGGRQPGANTLLYLPLNTTDTYTDQSGNSRTVSNYGIQFGTYSGVDCAYFDNGSENALVFDNFTIPSDLTVSWWQYQTQAPSDPDGKSFQFENNSDYIYVAYANWTSPAGIFFETKYNGSTTGITTGLNPIGKRVYFNFTSNSSGSTLTTIDNGTTQTRTNIGHRSFTPTVMGLGNDPLRIINRKWIGYMSEFIMESVVWTAQEISDYYNKTKSLYGIS